MLRSIVCLDEDLPNKDQKRAMCIRIVLWQEMRAKNWLLSYVSFLSFIFRQKNVKRLLLRIEVGVTQLET